jgi:hypothetical protein
MYNLGMSAPGGTDFAMIGGEGMRQFGGTAGAAAANDKAASRRLVVKSALPIQKFLERAKGFEPSTPTLARS